MIDDLDRTVEELLRRELSRAFLKQVEISFAAPDSDFPPSGVILPAVDLFLYDVRENMELRSPGFIVEHNDDGTATKKRKPVRVDCSYLITAWTPENKDRPIQEHFLLSEVMKVLVRYPLIPEVLLQGVLKGQEPPLPAATLQPGRLQSVSEFWQALGGKPKAALNYTVTIGLVPDRPIETEALVIEKGLKFRQEELA